jgi:hypothetical protein
VQVTPQVVEAFLADVPTAEEVGPQRLIRIQPTDAIGLTAADGEFRRQTVDRIRSAYLLISW